MLNMELDDNPDFSSAAEFLDVSLEFLFFDPIDTITLPSVPMPATSATATAAPISTNPINRIFTDSYTPKVVVEDLKGNLAVKDNVEGTRYYCTVPLYDIVAKSLDKIAATDEHWSTVPGNSSVYAHTNDDTKYLNDLSVPCVTESEYWNGFFTLENPGL